MNDLFNMDADRTHKEPADYLAELVGEGKKFKDLQELAKGKYEADQYIQSQNRQMDELRELALKLREDANKRASLEDQLTELRQQLTSSDNTHNANEDERQPTKFDPKELAPMISDLFKENKRMEKEQENYNFAVAKLKEKLGENYQVTLRQQATELGLSENDINDLARKSPKALLQTLGFNDQRQDNFQSPPSSQMRPEFTPKGKEKRTYAFYQNMKKENPMAYLDPKISVQMHKDAQEMGESFFDV